MDYSPHPEVFVIGELERQTARRSTLELAISDLTTASEVRICFRKTAGLVSTPHEYEFKPSDLLKEILLDDIEARLERVILDIELIQKELTKRWSR